MEAPHPTLQRTLGITVTAAVVVAALVLLWNISQVLLLLFTGLLLAVFLHGVASGMSRFTHLPRNASLSVFVVLMLALGAGLVLWLAPRVRGEAQGFREQIPRAVARLQDFVEQYVPDSAPIPQDLSAADLLGNRADLIQRFTGVFSSTVGFIGSALIVLFTGLFLAAAPETYRSGVIILFPVSRRSRVRQILDRLGETLWWWIIAKLGSMTVVGVLTGLGLYFLHVPLLFSLALLSALMTFIPNVGPVLAAVPAILLGLLEGPQQALWIALMYVAVQTVESYMITPFLQQRAISIPPVLVISAQVTMGVLAGAAGLLVATPLTAVVMVLVRELYLRDVLHEPLDASG